MKTSEPSTPSKEEQKRLLIEMMKEDEKNGMYEHRSAEEDDLLHALNLIEVYMEGTKTGISQVRDLGEAYNLISGYLKTFKKGDQTEQRWISVDEEKPPYYQNVLVYGGHTKTRINVAWRATDDSGQDCYTRLNSQGLFVNVTHWMPLPSPPKL